MAKMTRSIAAKKAWMVRSSKRKFTVVSMKKVKTAPGIATRPAKWISPQSAGPTGMKGL